MYHIFVYVSMYSVCTPMSVSAHTCVHEGVYSMWAGQELCPSRNLRPLGPCDSLPSPEHVCVCHLLVCGPPLAIAGYVLYSSSPTYWSVSVCRRLRSSLCVSGRVALVQDRMRSELRPFRPPIFFSCQSPSILRVSCRQAGWGWLLVLPP